MSWHFSQALEAEYLAERCSDGEPFAQWKSIPSAADDSCSAKMKATCHRSPFGMMFVHSTDGHGVELLTSFRAASRARTSALQGKALESTGHGLGCGKSSLGSLARYDRDSRSWRTPQTSLVAGLDVFSETWPRWGSMRSGVCWERTPSEPHTNETGFGFSLPTLTRCGNYNRKGSSPTSGDGLATALAKLPTLRRTDGERVGRGDLIQALRGNPNKHWITLSANDSKPAGQKEVEMMKLYESGTNVPDTYKRLRSQVAARTTMSTLTKQDAHNNGSPSQQNRNKLPLNAEVGGPLNPDWCEWFMGWPIRWTASAPLETGKFQQWLRSHGEFCQEE